MISSGGKDGGAGGSGSVPNRRTSCPSAGVGVSGPCASCALANNPPTASANAIKEIALRLATTARHANVAAADFGGRFCVNPCLISSKEFITGLDAVRTTRSRLEVPLRKAYSKSQKSWRRHERGRPPLCYNLPFRERAQTSQALFRIGKCARGRLPLFHAARRRAPATERLHAKSAGRPRRSLRHRPGRPACKAPLRSRPRPLGRQRQRSERRARR